MVTLFSQEEAEVKVAQVHNGAASVGAESGLQKQDRSVGLAPQWIPGMEGQQDVNGRDWGGGEAAWEVSSQSKQQCVHGVAGCPFSPVRDTGGSP